MGKRKESNQEAMIQSRMMQGGIQLVDSKNYNESTQSAHSSGKEAIEVIDDDIAIIKTVKPRHLRTYEVIEINDDEEGKVDV
ncbi:hypothetical protein NPIL_15181 [Nephila pilipes]|uniref:Uncharacterized protein n=1 Tax=Nephila pilipes TaxID=299642 RepID=A0A8X6NIP6_NEPPI|nr:hypothetical protein NPIL_15181 [Nephila pilipes]